jgi:hypothetical protein
MASGGRTAAWSKVQMSGLSVSILTLSKRITETPNADEHGSAVLRN